MLVRDANWLIVVLLNLEGGSLEIWGQHGGLESAASGDAVGGVQSTGWVLLENLLDLSDAAWDTSGFSNQLNAIDLVIGQAYRNIRNQRSIIVEELLESTIKTAIFKRWMLDERAHFDVANITR